MKNLLIVLMILPLLLSAADLYLVGDSTMQDYRSQFAPMTGWGTSLKGLVKPDVKVTNLAMGGRSSKSFLTEKRWEPVLKEGKPGDFVIIQFGHNDAVTGAANLYRSTNAEVTFKLYLKIYIAEARANGLIPVLCTKTAVCRFRNGEVFDVSIPHVTACREVAAETGCDLVDLNAYAHAKFPVMGEPAVKKLYMILEKGESSNYPDGKTDTCHLRDKGAEFYAEGFVELAREQNLKIAELFK